MSDELTAVRIDRYTGTRYCQTASHRSGRRPPAVYVLHKPALEPALPGPERNYLCADCMAVFMQRTAIPGDLLA